MMLQSVDNNKKYTWDNNWIHPYESVWGIFEKFKAANVLPSKSLNKIVSLSSGKGRKLNYDELKYIYSYSNLFSNYDLPDILHYDLEIFKNIKLVLSQRLRYCPICIKQVIILFITNSHF